MESNPFTKDITPALLKGRRVLVVGMARSGIAAAQLLAANGAVPVLYDAKPESAFGNQLDELRHLPCEWFLGQDDALAIKDCALAVLSPGVPTSAPVAAHIADAGIPLVGELELAAELAQGTLVAVTGTNGKTTTVTLLGEIFRAAGKLAYVAGNVGYPLSAAVLKAKREDVLVAEVSSFQLETVRNFHPVAAAMLNITPDHLNRHGTMETYIGLKKRIFDNMGASDVAVLNYDDAECRSMAEGLKARVCFFSRLQTLPDGVFVLGDKLTVRLDGQERAVCAVDEISIPGPHNLENALAAAAIAYARGVPAPVIRHALRTFRGVEHRLEFVRVLDGVRYINDSKGTNVDSTVKAVDTMSAPTVLILGGYDKHVPFDALAERIARSGRIANVVLMGQTAPQIEQALREAGYQSITHAFDLDDALSKARALSQQGGNVLFSPACASFDMFSDFEARGRAFKQLVRDLK